MKLYLAGQFPSGGAENCMRLYLAESGGVQEAYFTEKNMKLYLAEAGGGGKRLPPEIQTGIRRCGFTSRGGAAAQDSPQLSKKKNEHEDLRSGHGEIRDGPAEMRGGDWNIYEGANILQSFYYCNNYTEKVIIPNCKSFLLDSGAFSFFSNGQTPDWDEYIERYADFINRNHIELFFELDIDQIIGYEKVLKLREKLTRLTGRPPIPVWHKSRGKDEFVRMCDEFDYVALGGIAGINKKGIEYKKYHEMFPWFINQAHKRDAKIHGLGYTSLQGLTRNHFDSVDSTSWVSGNRYGTIYKFNGKTMIYYSKPSGKRVRTNITAINNFLEWKKFSNWAETNL